MTCKTCRFWTKEECHRMPPVVLSQTWSNTEGYRGEYRESISSNQVTAWPETAADEWCGEHQPNP
jgi:hypothetical protein